MNTMQLRDIIQAVLPAWMVTINEQTMLNVQADDLDRYSGFVYVEEFAQGRVDYSGFGRKKTYVHDVYFCTLAEFDLTAEQRQDIREERLAEAVKAVEDRLHHAYQVDKFQEDYDPRGFDANEVLIHIRFESSEKTC